MSLDDSYKYYYKCIVPGCETNREGNENLTTLFHFPQIDHLGLLERWKQFMPFLNYNQIDLSTSLICELHFEAHQIIQTSTSTRKMLVMDAVPTLFGRNCYPEPELVQTPSYQTSVSCRFCLKTISSDEMIEIDREIRHQFEDVTQTELKMSAFFSSVSCISCCRDLRKCSSIKYKLLKNQEKLYEMIDPKDSVDNISSDGNNFPEMLEMDGKVEVKLEVTDDMVKIKDEPGTTMAWQHDPLEENAGEQSKSAHHREKTNQNASSNIPMNLKSDYYGKPVSVAKKSKQHRQSRKHLAVRDVTEYRKQYAKEKVLCADCGQHIARSHMKRHRENYHDKIKNFECDYCGRQFYFKRRIRDHLKLHIKLKDIPCEFCDMKFTSKNTLLIHKKIHHFHRYAICCELCGERFNNKDLYNTHIRAKHTGEKPFVCDQPECGKAFHSKVSLYCHKTQVHREAATCEICAKVTKDLKSHMKSHIGYQFICNFVLEDGTVCGKKFITNSRLRQHEDIHVGIKRFVCKYCSMAYARSGSLNNHIRGYHMKFKLKCDLPGCNSEFVRKKNLRSHVMSAHKHIGEENLKAALERVRNIPLPVPSLEISGIME